MLSLSTPDPAPVPGATPLDLEMAAAGGTPSPPAGRRLGRGGGLVTVVAGVVWSRVDAGIFGGETFNGRGLPLVGRFLSAAASPELSADFLRLTLDATVTTAAYAVLGTALSTVLGLAGGIFVSEMWWRRAGRSRWRRRAAGAGWLAARTGLVLPRGVHEAVWGLFLVQVLGLDPLVGVLAIAIPFGAITAKVFAEILDEAPRGPVQALHGAGAGQLAGIVYAAVPAALGDLSSYAFYRLECSVRAAAILGVIGAGGLGFELALSFQTLRYHEMWTLIGALVAVSGLVDLWSRAVRTSTGARRRRTAKAAAVLAVVLIVVSVAQLAPDLSTLWSARTRDQLGILAAAAWPPDLGRTGAGDLVRLSIETLQMSVLAAAFATSGAMVVANLAARGGERASGGRRVAGWCTRALLLVLRAVPPPVWALLVLFVFFPGPLPGALALGVYNLGILGRLMAEVVENHDRRPALALAAQGASAGQAYLYGVIPQVVPRFAAYALYRWEVMIRETVVVGLVGAGGLGRLLASQLAAFDYQGVVVTVTALVVLTVLVDLASTVLRRSLR